jgi:Lrp/AsnC family leucine-responsive transcriptional regulator
MKKTEAQNVVVDDIDLQILSLLKENARISLKNIAAKTYLSSTAVAARMEKLEQNGYIKGYFAKIDSQKFGLTIKAFINLELEPIQKKDFYPYIRSCENVVQCNCVTGDYSMLIEVLFASTAELDHFINELQHFGKTKTQIVFSTPVETRDVLPKISL